MTTRQGRCAGWVAAWKGMPGPRPWRDPGGSCGFVDEPFGPAHALSGRVDKPWTTPWRRPPRCPHSRASRLQAPQDGNNNLFYSMNFKEGSRKEKALDRRGAHKSLHETCSGAKSRFRRVISSVVERFVHIEDVGSSSLSSPTKSPEAVCILPMTLNSGCNREPEVNPRGAPGLCLCALFWGI